MKLHVHVLVDFIQGLILFLELLNFIFLFGSPFGNNSHRLPLAFRSIFDRLSITLLESKFHLLELFFEFHNFLIFLIDNLVVSTALFIVICAAKTTFAGTST